MALQLLIETDPPEPTTATGMHYHIAMTGELLNEAVGSNLTSYKLMLTVMFARDIPGTDA